MPDDVLSLVALFTSKGKNNDGNVAGSMFSSDPATIAGAGCDTQARDTALFLSRHAGYLFVMCVSYGK